MNMSRALTRIALIGGALAFAATLTACGGSGSTTSSVPQQQSPAATGDRKVSDVVTCTPDSFGYCVNKTTLNEHIVRCGFRGENGAIAEAIGTVTYQIGTSTGTILTFVETLQDNGEGQCQTAGTWSPSDPQVSLGDPNLP